MKKTSVIGAGAWGTAFSIHLARCGYKVKMWVRERELAGKMKTSRRNKTFLPDFEIPKNVFFTNDLREAIDFSPVIFWAIPTQFLRGFLSDIKFSGDEINIILSKGIERDRWLFPYQIFEQATNSSRVCVLSGPSFAEEVARGLPTVLVAAAKNMKVAREIQHLVASQFLRVYRSDDVLGVSLGGAYKNIIAIAAGISDGLSLGHNARAALITRGLSEMVRLAERMGAKRETIFGAAGAGDMILTATSKLSRNYSVGFRIGKGEKFSSFKGEMIQVAEGVFSTFGAMHFAKIFDIELPIAEQVHNILWNDKSPEEGVKELMTRPLKEEW